jgi:hypothetical protein
VAKVVSKILADGVKRVVVTDWRFPSEEDHFSAQLQIEGFQILKLRVERWRQPPLDDNTETALDKYKFDATIENTGTMHDLQCRVMSFLQTFVFSIDH